MIEEWKDIVIEKNGVTYDFTGKYQVSNFGRVRSLNYNHKTGKIKLLKINKHGNGYCVVSLYENKKQKQFLVHRLVAFAFIPNPNGYTEVNHIDENKENNHVENLEWCTREYNMTYGTSKERRVGKVKGRKHTEDTKRKMSKAHKGEKHHYYGKKRDREVISIIAKKRKKKVVCLNTLDVFDSIKEAGEWCGVGKTSINQCLRGHTKTSGKHPETGEKLKWMYYDKWLEQQNTREEDE